MPNPSQEPPSSSKVQKDNLKDKDVLCMFKISTIHLVFEGEENIKVLSFLQVLFWGFDEGWRFLTGVLHLDPDLDMVIAF